MPKVCLTPEIVDALVSPAKGEKWLGDNHVEHFGIRTWAGKRGGGKAYAIRLRDQFGLLVRETFDPIRDYWRYQWDEGWEKPLGYFLESARDWARDRVAIHLGLATAAYRQNRAWQRRKERVLATKIGDAFDRRLKVLRRKSRNHLYVDHIQNLVGIHIPPNVLNTTFRNVPIRSLADSLSKREISYGNVKVLRAFVGGVFKRAADQYGPLHYKLESIQRRCSRNLDARKATPYPQILGITEADYRSFFNALERDECWRQSLAIRFYFATGAKLQQVRRARWSDIIDTTWFPFVPAERKLWYESREHLREEAATVLGLIQRRHYEEGLASPYLFPAVKNEGRPIATVQRHWSRYCGTFRWNGLPLSHVVLRHRGRSNPSYSLFFWRTYLNFERPEAAEAVSKVANRRKNPSINAVTYMVEQSLPENLIA